MSEKIVINYATAIILNKVCDEILYENKTNPDGSVSRVERPVSFRLKYRLQKNKSYLEKDVYNFEKWKTQLLATYGSLVTDDAGQQQVKIVDPEKKKLFINSLNKILATEIAHSITKIDPTDIDQLNFPLTAIDYGSMKLFIGFMCAEPELIKELNTEIDFDFGDLTGDKEVELKKEDNDKDTTKEISDNNNENETDGSEVKKTRKTTRKKTTTKTSKSKKTTTEEKE